MTRDSSEDEDGLGAASGPGNHRPRKRKTKRKVRKIDRSHEARKKEERETLAKYNVEGVHIRYCSVVLEPLEDAEFSENESIGLDSESRDGGDSDRERFEFTENDVEVDGPDREVIEEELRQTLGRGIKRKAEDEPETIPTESVAAVEDVDSTMDHEASSEEEAGVDLETAFQHRADRMVRITLKGVNIDANFARQIEAIHPDLRDEDIVNTFFSYFFFVQFDSSSSRDDFARRLRQDPKWGLECTSYCSGCAYAVESSVARHLEECKSDDFRDLNKMCKVFQGLPAFKR
jgi:hypothetical protein